MKEGGTFSSYSSAGVYSINNLLIWNENENSSLFPFREVWRKQIRGWNVNSWYLSRSEFIAHLTDGSNILIRFLGLEELWSLDHRFQTVQHFSVLHTHKCLEPYFFPIHPNYTSNQIISDPKISLKRFKTDSTGKKNPSISSLPHPSTTATLERRIKFVRILLTIFLLRPQSSKLERL